MFSCAEVAEYYRLSALRCEAGLSLVISTTVASGAQRARATIGHSQPGWDPLSTATLEGFRHWRGRYIPGKNELGYSPPENPLLREGGMRESITSDVSGLVGIVGSDQKKALWHELGVPGADYPIPPRPFLATGLMEAVPGAAVLAGELAVSLLTPRM